jgi:transcriptional regulator with XRE-family HTH domain
MTDTKIHIDHQAIGRRIAGYRQKFAGVGMSQGQLAEKSGLNRHTIRNYENGRGMTLESALRISQVLGIGLYDLLEGWEKDPG